MAGGRGLPVLWGRCWEAGGAPAYWPWLDVLAGLARALDDRALGEALGDGAALVAELLPGGAGAARERPPPRWSRRRPSEARFRLWRAVSGLCSGGRRARRAC